MERSSGVLMAMSSLPSKYGIGTLGKAAYDFVDFLSAAGQKYWQLLPLGPTSFGDSPYSSFSSFAGSPYYIDLEPLSEDGYLKDDELSSVNWGEDETAVDYGALYERRFKILRLAYERSRLKLKTELDSFHRENAAWLDNYALFMALKAQFGMKSWTQWPDEAIRKHQPKAVREYSDKLKDETDFYIYLQYLFFKQWAELRAYAKEKGISFIGDIPIYVALDSADVWSEPRYFQLDGDNIPIDVAGVPPDDYTAEGQLWGNPLYDWEEMKRDGYGWWIRRIDGARRLYDLLRIDHFRGFDSYWAVPNGDKTAVNGVWKKGPGMELVGVLTSWFYDLRFIAEDLGYPTPGVKKLLADSGLPGMKVLEFAFDSESDSDYLPHNCIENSVCYLGTHDNNTVMGWLSDISEADRAFAESYMNISENEGWCWGLIRTGMATPSKLFIVTVQDLLSLGVEARMNTPGSAYGNWRWRVRPEQLSDELAEKLREYTERFRRMPKV